MLFESLFQAARNWELGVMLGQNWLTLDSSHHMQPKKPNEEKQKCLCAEIFSSVKQLFQMFTMSQLVVQQGCEGQNWITGKLLKVPRTPINHQAQTGFPRNLSKPRITHQVK